MQAIEIDTDISQATEVGTEKDVAQTTQTEQTAQTAQMAQMVQTAQVAQMVQAVLEAQIVPSFSSHRYGHRTNVTHWDARHPLEARRIVRHQFCTLLPHQNLKDIYITQPRATEEPQKFTAPVT